MCSTFFDAPPTFDREQSGARRNEACKSAASRRGAFFEGFELQCEQAFGEQRASYRSMLVRSISEINFRCFKTPRQLDLLREQRGDFCACFSPLRAALRQSRSPCARHSRRDASRTRGDERFGFYNLAAVSASTFSRRMSLATRSASPKQNFASNAAKAFSANFYYAHKFEYCKQQVRIWINDRATQSFARKMSIVR